MGFRLTELELERAGSPYINIFSRMGESIRMFAGSADGHPFMTLPDLDPKFPRAKTCLRRCPRGGRQAPKTPRTAVYLPSARATTCLQRRWISFAYSE